MPNGTSILKTTEFEGLGKLCFLQLAELRHRGAFSTVAQTFATFCLRCSRSSDPEIKRLLDVWYEVRGILSYTPYIFDAENVAGNASLHS